MNFLFDLFVLLFVSWYTLCCALFYFICFKYKRLPDLVFVWHDFCLGFFVDQENYNCYYFYFPTLGLKVSTYVFDKSINAEETFWDGNPCRARYLTVVVANDPTLPDYWAKSYIGTVRKAIEISIIKRGFLGSNKLETFIIDNERGNGYFKITKGMGSWKYAYGVLAVKRIITTSDFYTPKK